MNWCYSTSEELFNADCEGTREEAIRVAICDLCLEVGNVFYLGTKETVRGEDLLGDVGWRIIEAMQEAAYDRVGEVSECWPDNSDAEEVQLTEAVEAAVKKWLDDNGLQPTFYAVDNVERIEVTEELWKLAGQVSGH